MPEKIMQAWRYVQALLDIQGDVVMLGFTGAVVYKILHGGLSASDAAAYSAAIAALGYSKGQQK